MLVAVAAVRIPQQRRGLAAAPQRRQIKVAVAMAGAQD
jgi:hypothetical protein